MAAIEPNQIPGVLCPSMMNNLNVRWIIQFDCIGTLIGGQN